MNFLDTIFRRLAEGSEHPVLEEIRDGKIVAATGAELRDLIEKARAFLLSSGLRMGDRCVLLAPNSIRWAALDVAMMAEGIIVVLLYVRQAPAELVGMMKDCSPSRICCNDEGLRETIARNWAEAPPISLFDEVFAGSPRAAESPRPLEDRDALTIIYTSGTSGQPKGVMLTLSNLNHMLSCTNERLDRLMDRRDAPDRVFHYLPFCFAGSWVLLLTCLTRNSRLALSTDLTKLADEMRLAAPEYFLNVPALLERVRTRIEEQIRLRGGIAAWLFAKARTAYLRRHNRARSFDDAIWLGVAKSLLFPAIRGNIGRNLKALICGSAPLEVDTQLFFMMLGIPILQVYGLTETTAICTMDDPRSVAPGRVGPAIPGIEMKLGENDEILVRGPNVFPGYWQRPGESANALREGWFHTGDQGDMDASGNWRIIGRLKDLIVLNSGHNVAPAPLEDALARLLPGAQAILVGNDRSFLAAILTTGPGDGTSDVAHRKVRAALDQMNAGLPHYKQIRAFQVIPEPFTIENGLLTPNGKLRRDAIAARFHATIERLYEKNA
jgi:long-chain acyl-CoA synthetase